MKNIISMGCDYSGQNFIKSLMENNFEDIDFSPPNIDECYRFHNIVCTKNPYWWYTSMRRRMPDFRIKPIDINYFKLWGHQNTSYIDMLCERRWNDSYYIRMEDLLVPEDILLTFMRMQKRLELSWKNKENFWLPEDTYKHLNFAVYQEYMTFYDPDSLDRIKDVLYEFRDVMEYFKYGIAKP